MSEEVTIAYDTELRRPGCALVQAGYGCSISPADLDAIGHWLTAPTDAMRVYKMTAEQVAVLVQITQEHNSILRFLRIPT
jgi:hypothetical protein